MNIIKQLAAALIIVAVTLTGCKDDPEDKPTYTVTFDSAGGSAVDALTVKSGTPAKAPANPVRDGYEFLYWTLNGEHYVFSKPVTGNITLTAKWQEITAGTEYWQVQWSLGGGAWPEGDNHETRTVKGGTLAEPNAPVKDGGTFDGWYSEAALTNKITFPNTVTADMTLYAKWTKEEEPGETNAFTIRNTAEWNAAVNIIKAGNSTEYILTVEGTISVPPTTGTDDGYITATTFGKAKTVTLAGSGMLVLSGKGFLACIDGQKLIIDGPTLKGISDNTEPLVHVEDNATLELKSGKITGNTNTDSDGGGVKLRGTGTVFTMSGGEITGNSASGGGGVNIGYSATFTLSGGTISDNTAKQGGGIRLSGGGYGKEAYFYMTGGVIKSNTATAPSSDYPGGGGVALYSSTIFYKTGGIIYGSDATDADKNRVVNSNSGSTITTRGSAVVHHIDNVIGDNDDIFRETTLGETDDLNTKDETTNWGK